MTAPSLVYPIIVLGPDFGANREEGRELVDLYFDNVDFTSLSTSEIKAKARDGALVTDVEGRNWRILRATDLGPRVRRRGFFGKVFSAVFPSGRQVAYEFAQTDPIPFETIRERVGECIRSNWDHWRNDELLAGEAAPPVDEQALIDEMVERIRSTTSMAELTKALQINIDIVNDDLPDDSDVKRRRDAGEWA